VSDPTAQSAQYQRARTEFDKLSAEDKAAFVVETAFAAVGEALASVGRQVASAMDDLRGEPAPSAPEEPKPKPKRPPTRKPKA
jgi:hypothetical protein